LRNETKTFLPEPNSDTTAQLEKVPPAHALRVYAASSHIENENEMMEHTDALKILILPQLLLE
jgi:hypothetical protein